MTYDPLVLTHLSTLMQRAADYVRLGYCHWVSGEIAADKVKAFTQKLDKLYCVGRTRHQKAYARLKGEASAVLLLYSPRASTSRPTSAVDAQTSAMPALPPVVSVPAETKLRWFLLISSGEHLAFRLERLRNATEVGGRLQIGGYELVQLPRPGQAAPAWSWRMAERVYEGWRARIILIARRQPDRLSDELSQLARTPGFAGCRAQIKKLFQLAKGEYQRHAPNNSRLILPKIRYVQRISSGDLTLSQWRNLNCYT